MGHRDRFGLGPHFEHIERHIDLKTNELKDTLDDQQRVIDTLAVRSIKHKSETNKGTVLAFGNARTVPLSLHTHILSQSFLFS